MTVEEQIYSALSELAGGRVYPLVAPEKTNFPIIVYTRIASSPSNTITNPPTIDQVRVQVDTYASTYSAAKDLSRQVRNVFESAAFKGTLQTDQDFFETELKVYRVSQDYYVFERNST